VGRDLLWRRPALVLVRTTSFDRFASKVDTNSARFGSWLQSFFASSVWKVGLQERRGLWLGTGLGVHELADRVLQQP
jgi:hypothetical protein